MRAVKTETLENIVNKADELEILRGLRVKIAKTMDGTESGRDIAALSKQLREVSARITELEDNKLNIENITTLDLILLKARLQDRKRKLPENDDEIEDINDELEELQGVLDVMRENGGNVDE